jgi:pSer/pThr/pTyr-binding forkhead associated (FHA) protein
VGSDAPDTFLAACGLTVPIRLSLERPEFAGTMSFRFQQPFLVIGSHPDADLRLDHPDVGRRHAYLQVVSGRIYCTRLQSQMGIQHSSGGWSERWLQPGDAIVIGPFQIRWEEESDEPPIPDDGDDWPAPTSRSFVRPSLTEGALEFIGDRTRPSPWRLSRALVICGRSAFCKVRLTGTDVSELHCGLVRTSDGIWLVDLLSRTGTMVNGQSVRYTRLAFGDELEVGRHRLRLVPVPGTSVSGLPARREDKARAASSITDIVPAASTSLVHTPDVVSGSDMSLQLMVRELGQLQQQNADQFQQSLFMLFRMFSDMHKEQMGLIREELASLHRLSERERALEKELARRTVSAGGSGGGSAPTLRLVTGEVPSPRVNGATDPGTPAAQRGPEPRPARFVPPRGVAASRGHGPTPDASTAHMEILERIAAIRDERQSRWRKLLNTMTGRSGGNPSDETRS